MSETAANGVTVDTVAATDADGVTYALTGGNTGSTFRIDSASGEIIVQDDSTLDYDAGPTSYHLIVTGSC